MSVDLPGLLSHLRASPALRMKQDIQSVARGLGSVGECAWLPPGAGPIRNGDDAAAIPDGDGHILLAAEGMWPGFVRREPWFSGYCAVMVNASDIAAMGGRPLAVVDVLFAGDDLDQDALMRGMGDAAAAFGIPVVGGHTSRVSGDTALSAAIVGRARRLITSFDARPGQTLLLAVQMAGDFRGDSLNFDAATGAEPDQLRAQLGVLPALAEAGLVAAGKDVSMAGIVGTLAMLCESSGCGAVLRLPDVPLPPGVGLSRFLQCFPSFGFVLAAEPAHVDEVTRRFAAIGVACAPVGHFSEGARVELHDGERSGVYRDLAAQPLTGFSPAAHASHAVAEEAPHA